MAFPRASAVRSNVCCMTNVSRTYRVPKASWSLGTISHPVAMPISVRHARVRRDCDTRHRQHDGHPHGQMHGMRSATRSSKRWSEHASQGHRERAKLLKLTVYYWLTKIIPPASYSGSRFARVPIRHEYQCWAKDYGGWRCRRLWPDVGWSTL